MAWRGGGGEVADRAAGGEASRGRELDRAIYGAEHRDGIRTGRGDVPAGM